MTLRERRVLFSILFSRLVLEAFRLGYHPAINEVKRDPRVAAMNAASGIGIKNSLHLDGLAGDLILYKDIDGDGDQDYLTDTEDYRELGEWWKRQHPLCRWGGDFKDRNGNPKPDGNHFEITQAPFPPGI